MMSCGVTRQCRVLHAHATGACVQVVDDWARRIVFGAVSAESKEIGEVAAQVVCTT